MLNKEKIQFKKKHIHLYCFSFIIIIYYNKYDKSLIDNKEDAMPRAVTSLK